MSLTLSPLTDPALAGRLSVLLHGYSANKAKARRIPLDRARADAEQQIKGLLPDGVRTEGMLLFAAEVDGEEVGWIWIGLPGTGGGDAEVAWLHEVLIDPPYRGRGYGRAIIQAAERELARRGVAELGLNVFGDNTVARRLYESLGFEVAAQQMVKTIG